MVIHLLLIVFFSLDAILPASGTAEAASQASEISPVYEEMLANQIVSLRQELIQKQALKSEVPFLVIGWEEKGNALASKVVGVLKHRDPAVDWQSGSRENWERKSSRDPFQGIVFVWLDVFKRSQETFPEDLESAISFLKDPGHTGFLVVFVSEWVDPAAFDSVIQKSGLNLHMRMVVSELEFVKDESGRQIVDLDFPQYRNLIFERLVREGVNPVAAHAKAEEAIQNFRQLRDSKILIVSKD